MKAKEMKPDRFCNANSNTEIFRIIFISSENCNKNQGSPLNQSFNLGATDAIIINLHHD